MATLHKLAEYVEYYKTKLNGGYFAITRTIVVNSKICCTIL